MLGSQVFIKHLLSNFCRPSTVLDARDPKKNKTQFLSFYSKVHED